MNVVKNSILSEKKFHLIKETNRFMQMFAKLNAVAMNLKTLKKISDLEINRCYIVEAVKKVVTKYGEKIIVELENNIYCYLPARVSKELLANN